MAGKITIKYINGKEDTFKFEPVGEMPMSVVSELKEILNQSALIIQGVSTLEIIPFSNIQSISVIPARETVLRTIKIKGAIQGKKIS